MTAAHLTTSLALALEVHALRAMNEKLYMKMSILRTMRRMDGCVRRRYDDVVRIDMMRECVGRRIKEMRRRMDDDVVVMVELMDGRRVYDGMDGRRVDDGKEGRRTRDREERRKVDDGMDGHRTRDKEEGQGLIKNGHRVRDGIGQERECVEKSFYRVVRRNPDIPNVEHEKNVLSMEHKEEHKNKNIKEKIKRINKDGKDAAYKLTSTCSSPHLRNYKRLNEYASFPFLRPEECELLIVKRGIAQSIEIIRTVINKEMDVFLAMMTEMGVIRVDRKRRARVNANVEDRGFIVGLDERCGGNGNSAYYGQMNDADAKALREQEKRVVQHMHEYISDGRGFDKQRVAQRMHEDSDDGRGFDKQRVVQQMHEDSNELNRCRLAVHRQLLKLRECVAENVLKSFERLAQRQITGRINTHGWIARYGSKSGKKRLIMKMKEEIETGDGRTIRERTMHRIKLKIKRTLLFMHKNTLRNCLLCVMRIDKECEEERMKRMVVEKKYEEIRNREEGLQKEMHAVRIGENSLREQYEEIKIREGKLQEQYKEIKIRESELLKEMHEQEITNVETRQRYEEDKMKEIELQKVTHEQEIQMMHEQYEIEREETSALVAQKLKACHALKGMALRVLNNKCIAYTCIDIERNLYRIQSNIFYAEFILLNAIHQSLKMVVRTGTIENDERLVDVINSSLRDIEGFKSPRFVKMSVELEISKRYVKDLIKIKKVLKMFSLYSEEDC
ncbi:hypothetical protein THOM_0246 [Trachipleistophora hominis]|uniref:Uncharacterized protein n=1 Tax=Trachipleistophora hominis TaxID=72359 RepID=L7JZ79_TRAHO|nr:hypothetical protein THOM_0246 [Trachipleistophora hominis]